MRAHLLNNATILGGGSNPNSGHMAPKVERDLFKHTFVFDMSIMGAVKSHEASSIHTHTDNYAFHFRINMGITDVVVLNTLETIKEFMSKSEILFRPETSILNRTGVMGALLTCYRFTFQRENTCRVQKKFSMFS